jgi:MerR family transcriptional regulator, light-induced transcriptional regulator
MSDTYVGVPDLDSGEPSLTQQLLKGPTGACLDPMPVDPGRLHKLALTIETAIIPRLLMNHGVAANAKASRAEPDDEPLGPDMVARFAKLTIGPDSSEAPDYIEGLLARGISKETVLMQVLAPAARLMGEMWTADLCSFVDVTLGLSRIQNMLRNFNGLNEDGGPPARVEGRALLIPSPGEQHTFGLRVLEEFLIREGWEVRTNLRASLDETLALVGEEKYDFVGISASGEALLPNLCAAIVAIRKFSRNRDIKVLVGGVLFALEPRLAKLVAADGCAIDPRDAIGLAQLWAGRHQGAQARLS